MISRWLLSRLMTEQGDSSRDLARLVVPAAGSLVSTGDPWEPYRLLDADGVVMDPVTSYFRDLQAAGRSTATLRSYGMDLLRWFRFTWVVGVPWSQATRVEARDFSCWIQATEKRRPESRSAGGDVAVEAAVGPAVAGPVVEGECELGQSVTMPPGGCNLRPGPQYRRCIHASAGYQ
jgi:hypothetical protein